MLDVASRKGLLSQLYTAGSLLRGVEVLGSHKQSRCSSSRCHGAQPACAVTS